MATSVRAESDALIVTDGISMIKIGLLKVGKKIILNTGVAAAQQIYVNEGELV